jgi:hypothetical protein
VVLRDGVESQRAECKGAERQGAEPTNCRTYPTGLLLLVTFIPLGTVFRLG